MPAKWKDVSSYSQGDKERVPKSFNIAFQDPPLRITVTRYLGYPPDTWVMHCHDLNMSERELVNTDLVRAQDEAIRLVTRRIQALFNHLANAEG